MTHVHSRPTIKSNKKVKLQPSDCIDLFVIDYIFWCYSRKINMMMMMIINRAVIVILHAIVDIDNTSA